MKKVDACITISSIGTRSGRVTRSQTAQNSKGAKLSDSSGVSKPRKKTAAKVTSKIVTHNQSNKGCDHVQNPASESDTSGNSAISDYEEGEFLIQYNVGIG